MFNSKFESELISLQRRYILNPLALSNLQDIYRNSSSKKSAHVHKTQAQLR